jgi:hypothetical protein
VVVSVDDDDAIVLFPFVVFEGEMREEDDDKLLGWFISPVVLEPEGFAVCPVRVLSSEVICSGFFFRFFFFLPSLVVTTLSDAAGIVARFPVAAAALPTEGGLSIRFSSCTSSSFRRLMLSGSSGDFNVSNDNEIVFVGVFAISPRFSDCLQALNIVVDFVFEGDNDNDFKAGIADVEAQLFALEAAISAAGFAAAGMVVSAAAAAAIDSGFVGDVFATASSAYFSLFGSFFFQAF